jgi:hypothetical protein
MNTRSDREYTMFVPEQLLGNLREQRPSNKGDLDSSGTRESLLHGGGPACDFIFVLYYVIVVGLRFKRHILYIDLYVYNIT